MSSKNSDNRSALLAALGQEFRQFATATVLFHQAIADRLGMHVTDHKCLDILVRTGPIPAGELAEQTGLTTGAITGVIDRLEKAGFVQRIKDPNDRRRVVIDPFAERIEKEIAPLFKSLAPAMAELCAHYGNRELTIIREFIAGVQRIAYEQIGKLRDSSEEPKAENKSSRRPSGEND